MPFSSSHIMSYTQNNHLGFDFVKGLLNCDNRWIETHQ